MPMNFFTPQTIRNIWGEWGRTPPEPGRPGKRQMPRTPLVSRQTLPEASGAVSVQRAAAEHGEILNGQKALRTGTGAIHQECFMHSRFSAPQAQCVWHFACPVRRAFCPLRISIRVRKCPLHRHRTGCLREGLAGYQRGARRLPAAPGVPAPVGFWLMGA
ncbi:MAG: hypothetical protein ACLTPC_06670 [Lacrimispora saccharolytica]